ncbi:MULTISPECIES: aminopeptidase P family protein [Burkholderia cepacia complex]|uniref:aminopeptidase P family protein n=1 Tax=Burkholderia cepacia complex TaxID=87882 RepID=UPI00048A3BB6|nr:MULTISPECIES: aminopeptidase P family protein [Burkholderia cepacia complex]AQQ29824.1 Xaa-Pro aminopeptidase [Burkholderia cenocepacia]MBR7987163.1 aminopeptidase P family protein [Burkholderia cenocepacia]MBR8091507.1 aminopeptidase P family protein [Burkholderia cenocepacia]MBR8156279.1 aminopeptidase P family protein [Burkholderia cenocepacia]MCA8086938.1 aminopeptidase P family protein [Burkholderia cenocepacia]
MNARLPEVSPVPARLALLRDAMVRENLAAYLVPSADPHLSEYLPERWQARRWLSGFTGSVGTLVVTADFAGLWVDSRYWVQADAELAGTGVQLMKMTGGQQSAPHVDWLAQNVAAGATVGVDGAVLGVAAARGLTAALSARGIALRTDVDLLDAIWPERPGLPGDAVFEHVAPQADTTRASKLAEVRRAMQAHGAQWHFVSTLDDLAWLFNLRGADVNFNPVFVAHAMIGAERATLFVADGKVPPALAASLAQDGVDVRAYDAARASLAALPDGATLLIDPRRVTFGTLEAVPAGVKLVEAVNPSTFAKSRKTSAEIEHVRVTMEHDGAALAEFFAWFEQAVNRETITELTIEEKLTAARARRPGYVSASFATIAGFNANGAMPHYHATRESHATIAGDGLLLIDSGGQYMTGTTDITRVVPVGTVSDLQRRDFTIVLKSMMALSRARFPRGIRSPMLDAIARAPMWAAGLDYGHGTGHGVGYFLNVHEGPQVISHYAPAEPYTAMEEGMITSIEPGVYRPGQWGIRIENLVVNRAAGKTEFGDFLAFETLTLCPIDTRCVLIEMLHDEERAWLNTYHATVRERVGRHVSGDAKAWLDARTQPI